jgi:hypothetical protein
MSFYYAYIYTYKCMCIPVAAGLLIRLRNSAMSEPFRCFKAHIHKIIYPYRNKIQMSISYVYINAYTYKYMCIPVEGGLLIRLRNSAINEPFRCFLALSVLAMIGAVSYKSIRVYIIMCI